MIIICLWCMFAVVRVLSWQGVVTQHTQQPPHTAILITTRSTVLSTSTRTSTSSNPHLQVVVAQPHAAEQQRSDAERPTKMLHMGSAS